MSSKVLSNVPVSITIPHFPINFHDYPLYAIIYTSNEKVNKVFWKKRYK
ncbi:hypothetical protein TREPR_2577 [Treponema primitia ZAS-2]|uniref:Uncharacterized protein n=1 Tax=Treponema primitia (strain ATCC BAA-887 / DSM 12427 / ZAS-2) TaxID=545694 RepID=F5YGK1_TREPZ|nr:hypothetical protein TREPR_2577 [Treponema primitia ZAS-2]